MSGAASYCRSFDLLKVSVGLVDRLAEGEGIIVFFNDLPEISQLVAIDDTEEHRLIQFGIDAGALQPGHTVTNYPGKFLSNLVGMGGNDGKLEGVSGALDNMIAHKVGDTAIRDTKGDRLIVQAAFRVDKERDYGNGYVDTEGDDKEVGVRLDLIDVAGDYVGSAGTGVVPEAESIDEAADHAAEDNRIDGIVAAGIVLKIGSIRILQEEIGKGVDQREDQRLKGELLIHDKVSSSTERNIDQQGHIADTEAGFILDHRCNTVQSGRSKMVEDDKDMVVQCQKQSGRNDDTVAKDGILPVHGDHLLFDFGRL